MHQPGQSHFHSRLLLSGILVLLSLSPSVAQSDRNREVLRAVEAFENLTEAATESNSRRIDTSFSQADKSVRSTRLLLPAADAAQFDKFAAEIRDAHMKHDNGGLSLLAAEVYKLLVSSLDKASLATPLEVSLLDYSGFRTQALLKAPSLDWTAITKTADEAANWWASIRDRVKDGPLRSAMNKTQEDLVSAARTRNLLMSQTAARKNLDSVDDLERYFSKARK